MLVITSSDLVRRTWTPVCDELNTFRNAVVIAVARPTEGAARTLAEMPSAFTFSGRLNERWKAPMKRRS